MFLETEKLIERCIQRSEAVAVELEDEPEMTLLSGNCQETSSGVTTDLLRPAPVSTCPSPASSEGGVYTSELLESFSLNLHRIDKVRHSQNVSYSFWVK